MTGRETMAAMTTADQIYLGSTAILRPGDRVQSDADVSGDPAMALADAWALADSRGGIPHIYELGCDGEGFIVVGDVLVTGRLAQQALAISGAA